jgi:hypothetical protein
MFDYKPSLTVLNNSDLLMAPRQPDGSLAQLGHVIVIRRMRSSDAGVSWKVKFTGLTQNSQVDPAV